MNFLSFFSLLQEHWIIVAFLAPFFWALVNSIDVYCVDGIYKDAIDGTIICGIFQIIPWCVLFFLVHPDPSLFFEMRGGFGQSIWPAFLGGIFFVFSFYFYFKALFLLGDVSLLQILWSTNVIVVPALTFLFYGEILPVRGYLGIGIILLGSLLLSLYAGFRERVSKKYIFIMLGAVFFLSLSVVIEGHTYGILSAQYGSVGFWTGFLSFGVGAFLTGIVFLLFSRRNIVSMVGRYYRIFVLSETLYFLGTLFVQSALNVAPSASYVIAIQMFVPVFIAVCSAMILFARPLLSLHYKAIAVRVYKQQLDGLGIKICATGIMVLGVLLIQ